MTRRVLVRLASDYGLVLALLALCGFLSVATLADQPATGPDAAARLAEELSGNVLVAVRDTDDDRAFAAELESRLRVKGVAVTVARGDPAAVRQALQSAADRGEKLAAVVAPQEVASWPVLQDLGRKYPALGDVPVRVPQGYRWPNFLKRANLLNVVNQITVIAILAVGMTLVILTGGIDLSVGSLIALSAVVAALLVRDFAGAEQAGAGGMILGCLGGIAACGAVGLASGAVVAGFRVPPFLVTLSVMLIASGVASELSGGESVYQLPPAFEWLGRGTDLFGLPNAVVLTAVLYLVAHVVLTRTPFGRHVYAVGGNREAARLSGVPVGRVLVTVYGVCGLLAGVGGVVMASQFRSGAPTYGTMYELYVIAAVVVGGTSLGGGEGKVTGTLLGALLIAVIQNGMNLTGLGSYTQKVVLGALILGAVLVDRLKGRAG
jgi:ribose transport system permease protein